MRITALTLVLAATAAAALKIPLQQSRRAGSASVAVSKASKPSTAVSNAKNLAATSGTDNGFDVE